MSPPRPSPPKFRRHVRVRLDVAHARAGLAVDRHGLGAVPDEPDRHRKRRASRRDRGEPDDDLVAQVARGASPELGALVDHDPIIGSRARARASAAFTAAVRVARSYAPLWRLPLMKNDGVPATPLVSALVTSRSTRGA